MAINNVVNVNTDPKNGFIPDTNMWCPQTIVDKNAIAKIDATIALYPKIGFLAFVDITSDVIPNAGNNTMYTSGCPKTRTNVRTALEILLGNAILLPE